MNSSKIAEIETVVTFRIGRQHYALPLEAVSQVVRLPDLTDIVGATPVLAGMLNLRGTFLPVLDGHALLGASSGYALDSSILVIALDNVPSLGLLADEVDDVEQVAAGGVFELMNSAPFISGIMHEHERSVILLEPNALRQVADTSGH